MKAAQITQYTKNIRIKVNNVPIPKMGDHDVLIRVKAAAVNPVDILNLTGAVRLIQDYQMPLTMGNECAGIVEKVGKYVTRFIVGDRVYSRVPISILGAFAEYVAIPENEENYWIKQEETEDDKHSKNIEEEKLTKTLTITYTENGETKSVNSTSKSHVNE